MKGTKIAAFGPLFGLCAICAGVFEPEATELRLDESIRSTAVSKATGRVAETGVQPDSLLLRLLGPDGGPGASATLKVSRR